MYSHQLTLLNKLNNLVHEHHEYNKLKKYKKNKQRLCMKMYKTLNLLYSKYDSIIYANNITDRYICELEWLTTKLNTLLDSKMELERKRVNGYWGCMIFNMDVTFNRDYFEKILEYEINKHKLDTIDDDIENVKNKIEDLKSKINFYMEIRRITSEVEILKNKLHILINEISSTKVYNKKIDIVFNTLSESIRQSMANNTEKINTICEVFKNMNINTTET